ncbi:HDIG domain-containing protein [bacterium]|nr:HDIG domain-containing protein [bacterium]
MDRATALGLLREQIGTDQLIKHCLATEAIMISLARELGQDEERWALIGLLHDLDFEETKDTPEQHTLKAAPLLKQQGFDDDFIAIIQSHNAEELGRVRTRSVEYALTAAESITGLIVATALVYPDKKIASVKSKSVRKRMKEVSFARAVSRERIRECEHLGMDLDHFIELSLAAMSRISADLGL